MTDTRGQTALGANATGVAPTGRAAISCQMTVGRPPGPRWAPLHCSVHGPQAAWVDRSLPNQATAAANAWANHRRIVTRAAEVQDASAHRLTAPYSLTCVYDTGSEFDCVPVCTAPAEHRIEYYEACYGWFVQDVCNRHRGATLGRVHPAVVRERPIHGDRGPR